MLPLLRIERQQKDFLESISNPILLFLCYSFGIEMTNTFIHQLFPQKPVFRPRRCKNRTVWGAAYEGRFVRSRNNWDEINRDNVFFCSRRASHPA